MSDSTQNVYTELQLDSTKNICDKYTILPLFHIL